jgi:hypothetical protein
MGEPLSPRRRAKAADESGKPGAGSLLRSTATKRWFKSRNAQVRFTELTSVQVRGLQDPYPHQLSGLCQYVCRGLLAYDSL